MKVRPFLLTAWAALLAVAIFSVRLFSQAPQSAGQISQLIPAVNIDRGNQRLVAAAQAPVFWNDLVATQPMARARIALGDGSILNVGSNSSLRVIQHDASAQQTQLELTYGKVRAKVTPLARSGAAFQIRTPVATAGVVGTDFFVQQGEGTAPPSPKVDLAVLPFAGASGVSLSDANTGALAQQLTNQLGQSGQMSSALISPPAGAAPPLGPQAAAQSGQAANASIVVLPVIQQAQARESTHGLGGLGGHFHIPSGNTSQLKHVDADVQIQVQMIRSTDGNVLKTLNVESKKGFNNVNVNVEGYSQDIGSADINNPNFQKSPLGQMLADAMSKVTTQVQSQASDALKAASSSPAAAAPAFDNNVATVVDFEGSVRFCNLQQQCVSVGPGMMSTIRAGQPPDRPHRADRSFIQEAQDSTDLGAAPPPAPTPVETAGARPPSMPALQPGVPVSCSGPPAAVGSVGLPNSTASAIGGWDFAARPFAATMVLTAKNRVTKIRYYAAPGAFRGETAEHGDEMIFIMRMDCGVIWSVMPKQQMYMELNLAGLAGGLASLPKTPASVGSQNIANAARMPNVKIDRQQIGAEEVSNYICDKYRITVVGEDGKTYHGTVWAARELQGFPIKWVDDDTGENVVFSDISLGTPDPSLFLPPPGYRKMTIGRQ